MDQRKSIRTKGFLKVTIWWNKHLAYGQKYSIRGLNTNLDNLLLRDGKIIHYYIIVFVENILSDNRQKAIAVAVLGSLESGDVTPILAYINADNYTQNTLEVLSGREYVNELINALSDLKKNAHHHYW